MTLRKWNWKLLGQTTAPSLPKIPNLQVKLFLQLFIFLKGQWCWQDGFNIMLPENHLMIKGSLHLFLSSCCRSCWSSVTLRREQAHGFKVTENSFRTSQSTLSHTLPHTLTWLRVLMGTSAYTHLKCPEGTDTGKPMQMLDACVLTHQSADLNIFHIFS